MRRGQLPFLVLCLLLCGLAAWITHSLDQNGPPEWIRATHGLKVSVLDFAYDKNSNELFSKLEFYNDGKTKRTVLSIGFQYRDLSEKNGVVHPLWAQEDGRFFYPSGGPIYVQPKVPAVHKFRCSAAPELIATPGRIFQLSITSLDDRGQKNWTTIDAMITRSDSMDDKLALMGIFGRRLSLDKVAGNYSLDRKTIRLSQMPVAQVKQPSPAGSASEH